MNTVGRRISSRGLAKNLVTRLQSSASSGTSNSSSPEIKIPPRIERGPTDILRALERTIKRDPTAPHYKYHDDPYLIPYSNVAKRSYALAEEAGRKSAMWIRQQHADLFQHRVADPVIEAFLPKAEYTKKEDVSEDILKNVIKNGHLIDALNIYKLLEENVTIQTKQDLLELLCFYNNESPLPEDLPAEKWYTKSDHRPKWKECSVTEGLFAFLKEQDKSIATKAYNAMICGCAKYIRLDKAWSLYEKAETNNIPLSATTYNLVIELIPFLKDNNTERITLLKELLKRMMDSGVQPNTGTFNSAIKVAASIKHYKIAADACRSIFAEFRFIGIEPSLAAYHHALNIFYKKQEGRSSLLKDVLNELEGKTLTMHDKFDSFFFVTAMDVAANYLEDPALGDRVHQLLLSGDNYNFIGSGLMENVYYKHYLNLQVRNQSLNDFIKFYYDIIVPHVYSPEPAVIDSIFSAIEVNDPETARPFVPRLWTHLVQFNHLERKNLVAKALKVMRIHCKPSADSNYNQLFGDAAWAVWTFVTEQQEKRIQKITWDGPILGDVAVLCLRANEFGKCDRIINFLFNERNSVVGMLEADQINELLEALILNCHVDTAMDLVHYCSDVGFEDTPSMAYKIWRNLSLNEWQFNRLKSLVGPEVLKVRSDDSQ